MFLRAFGCRQMMGEKTKVQSFVLRLTFISPPHLEHSEAKLSHPLHRLFELSLSPQSCGGAPVKTATPVFSVLTSACQMFGLLRARSRLAIGPKNTRTSKQTAAPATLLSSRLLSSPHNARPTVWTLFGGSRARLFHQRPSDTGAGQRFTSAVARVCVAK